MLRSALVRRLYSLLWWLVLPLLPLRLWWRGRREPGYRAFCGERFGWYGESQHGLGDSVLWIHAVSLGETRAVAPLVERLLRDAPSRTIVLTHMTATGREAGRALFGDRVVQAWLPYDIPFAVRNFVAHFRPNVGLLVETELWPNLTLEATSRNVPLLLINARLSERSARGYRSVASLSHPLFEALSGTAAQSAADARRLRDLGAHDVVVTGNMKFDVVVPDAQRERARMLRERFGSGRPVLVLASTREGEEALLLDALLLGRSSLPSRTLIVLVPRHPQRFDAVADLLEARAIRYVRRSAELRVPEDGLVVLGDSMGELLAYYVAADVAFVGGSLLPLGGQNLIEAIAAEVPTLVGNHTFNFAESTEAAIAAGAAVRVADANQVFATASRLLADANAREIIRASGRAFIAAHRGATDRLWSWLTPRLAQAAAQAPTHGIPQHEGQRAKR